MTREEALEELVRGMLPYIQHKCHYSTAMGSDESSDRCSCKFDKILTRATELGVK